MGLLWITCLGGLILFFKMPFIFLSWVCSQAPIPMGWVTNSFHNIRWGQALFSCFRTSYAQTLLFVFKAMLCSKSGAGLSCLRTGVHICQVLSDYQIITIHHNSSTLPLQNAHRALQHNLYLVFHSHPVGDYPTSQMEKADTQRGEDVSSRSRN